MGHIFRTLAVPTVVVVNDLYQEQVKKELFCSDHFVVQRERVGHGGAVRMCLPFIPLLEKHYSMVVSKVVVLYGDMPLWRPDSIRRLIEGHAISSAVVSMFSIYVKAGCPDMVERYGRILKDSAGRIIGVREPYQLSREEIMAASAVNPSAWVFDRSWLEGDI